MSFESNNESYTNNQLSEQIKQKEHSFKSTLIKQKEEYERVIKERDKEITEFIEKLIDQNTQLKSKTKADQLTIDILNKKMNTYSCLCHKIDDTNELNYSKLKSIISLYETNLETLNNEYFLTKSNLQEEFNELLSTLSLMESSKIRDLMIAYQNKIIILYDTMHSKDTHSLNLSYKNESLMQENNNIKSHLRQEKSSLIDEIRQLKHDTSLEIQNILSQVNLDLNSHRLNFNDDKLQIIQLTQEINNIKTELTAKEEIVKSLTIEIQRTYIEEIQLNNKLKEYSRVINDKNRIINANKESLSQLELDINLVKEENKVIQSKIKEMNKLIEVKDIYINSLTTQIEVKAAIASDELNIVKNTNQNINISLKNELNEKDDMLIKLQHDNSILSEDNKALNSKISSYEKQIQEFNNETLKKKDNHIQQHSKSVNKYKEHNQKLAIDNHKLTSMLHNTSSKLNEVKTHNKSLIKTDKSKYDCLSELQHNNNSLTIAQSELINPKEELSNKSTLMQDELDKMQSIINADKIEISILSNEKIALEKINQTQNDHLKEKINQLLEISLLINSIYNKTAQTEESKSAYHAKHNFTDIKKLEQVDNSMDKIVNSLKAIKALNNKLNHFESENKSLKKAINSCSGLTSSNNQICETPNINKINQITKGANGVILEKMLQEMIAMNNIYKTNEVKLSINNQDDSGKEYINTNKKNLINQINQLEDKVKRDLGMLNERLELLISYESVQSYFTNFQQQYELVINNLFESLLSFKVNVVNQTAVVIELPTNKYNEIIEITSKGIESIAESINKWLKEINNQKKQIDSAINLFNNYLLENI